MLGKIVNNQIVLPPNNDGNKFNVNQDSEWLEANGFKELTEAEINNANKAVKLARTVFPAQSIIEAIEVIDKENSNTDLNSKLLTTLSSSLEFSIYWSAYSNAINLEHKVCDQALSNFTAAEIETLKLKIPQEK